MATDTEKNIAIVAALAIGAYLLKKAGITLPGAKPPVTGGPTGVNTPAPPPVIQVNPTTGNPSLHLDPVPGDAPLAVDYAPGYGGPPIVYQTPGSVSPPQTVPAATGSGGTANFRPPITGTVEHGGITVDGKVFRDDQGNMWSWRGVSLFLLQARMMRGENILPEIAWMDSIGANVARVFGRVPVPGWEDQPDYHTPEDRPEFAKELHAFFTFMAGQNKRVEYVPITSNGDMNYMRRIVQQAFDIAADHPNVFIEVANEPEAQGNIDTVGIMQGINTRGVIYALGNYIVNNQGDGGAGDMPRGHYITCHTDRGSEWPRKSHDALYYRDELGVGGCPVILDEPIGAAEVEVPGRRSATPDDFLAYFGSGRLWAAGSTYHCDKGVRGFAPNAQDSPVQLAIGVVVGEAWAAIPNEAQVGSYQRCGGGAFPISCDVAESLRTYASVWADKWAVVRVRPISLAIIETSYGIKFGGPGGGTPPVIAGTGSGGASTPPPVVVGGYASKGSNLFAGDRLNPDEQLVSDNGKYRLLYQRDGNLVIYGPSGPIWATNTGGGPGFAVMQGAGNLVVYGADGHATWGSPGTDVPGSHAYLQDPGNLVVYAPDGTPKWSTPVDGGTGTPDAPSDLDVLHPPLERPIEL